MVYWLIYEFIIVRWNEGIQINLVSVAFYTNTLSSKCIKVIPRWSQDWHCFLQHKVINIEKNPEVNMTVFNHFIPNCLSPLYEQNDRYICKSHHVCVVVLDNEGQSIKSKAYNCSYLITAVYKIINVADILLPFLTFQILNLFKWKLKIVHMY